MVTIVAGDIMAEVEDDGVPADFEEGEEHQHQQQQHDEEDDGSGSFVWEAEIASIEEEKVERVVERLKERLMKKDDKISFESFFLDIYLGFLWIPVGLHWILSWFVLSDKVRSVCVWPPLANAFTSFTLRMVIHI